MADLKRDHLSPGPHDPPGVLPVIRGEGWFDSENRPFVLRVEFPLTFEEMVAALYGTADPRDIPSDEDLCGAVVTTLSIEGLPALAARARKLDHDEQRGRIESITFLTTCRHRVAGLIQSDVSDADGADGAGQLPDR